MTSVCAQVVDSAVLKFPKAVTHFSAGSYSSRPLQTTSFPNVFMAGDWVKGVPHGANGLSQVGPFPEHDLTPRQSSIEACCHAWCRSVSAGPVGALVSGGERNDCSSMVAAWMRYPATNYSRMPAHGFSAQALALP